MVAFVGVTGISLFLVMMRSKAQVQSVTTLLIFLGLMFGYATSAIRDSADALFQSDRERIKSYKELNVWQFRWRDVETDADFILTGILTGFMSAFLPAVSL